jgi:hypothetical protein
MLVYYYCYQSFGHTNDLRTIHLTFLCVLISRHSRPRGAVAREERALARRQRARGTTREVLSATLVAWKAGGYDAAELSAEDMGISSYHSPSELKGEGGIVMGSVGAQAAEVALAGSVGKEPVQIDGCKSCLVCAPHAGADTVQYVAPAGNEGMPIGIPSSRCMRSGAIAPPHSCQLGHGSCKL